MPTDLCLVRINGRKFYVPWTVTAKDIRSRVKASPDAGVYVRDLWASKFRARPEWVPVPERDGYKMKNTNRYEFEVMTGGTPGGRSGKRGCTVFEERDTNGKVIARGFACRRGHSG